ncbi:hypothetical protein GGP41_002265 [Bipolaris sorokiniana]|uniref:DDE-1 domain-containing protein n=1 Tax=Cochliobolus sativus TaxID=45130 RepID=A0A8H6DQ87_COCSA|nr:hypothetical protein GGP41_002265 [Bipolaris sorokiniana]
MKRVFDHQTKARANQKPRMLICDGFGTHETLEILEFCFKNNITLCRLPSNTSHKLQPCDVAVFAPLKTAYRDQVERLYRGGMTAINKEHFTALYYPARERRHRKASLRRTYPIAYPCSLRREWISTTTRSRLGTSDSSIVRGSCVAAYPSQAKSSRRDKYKATSEARAKLANAAEVSFAQQALDQHQI